VQERVAGFPVCPVCGGQSRQVSGEFEGYVEGYRLSVLECSGCDLRFSSRLDVPDELYERIYEHAATLPGYDRYAAYASTVSQHPDPLELLASSELPYWFVRDHVRNKLAPDGVVVDLGCGEGYLTYALRRAGFECVGVDLSSTVVARARRRFGRDDWFFTVDELARADFAGADLVVALELVEHVPEPARLLRDAVALLKDGGAVLMTTPNRDASSPEAVWQSDLPPVHLHWFGTRALTELAVQAGCDVEFREVPEAITAQHDGAGAGVWPALLTASGKPSAVVQQLRSFPWRARRRVARSLATVAGRLEASPLRQIPANTATNGRPPTLGAIFTPQSACPTKGNGQ
jgi:SAM-dependent methyltransferase